MGDLRRSGVAALMFVVVFFLGVALGYIVRDVRADEEVRQAAIEARQDVQETAIETLRRMQAAGADFAGGARAAAESTRSAVSELAGKERRDSS